MMCSGRAFAFAFAVIFAVSFPIEAREIKIGTSNNIPFVYKNQKGELEGFSIELSRAVFREIGHTPEFVHTDFSTKLANVKTGTVSAAIGGISLTESRARSGILFTYPAMNSGMTILVKRSLTEAPILPIILGNLFTWEVAKLLGFLLAVLLFWGFWLWLAERGSDVIRDSFAEGYRDAVWCAWAIKTTIGFGDVYPKKILGQTLTIPIFFSGAVLIAVVAAPINAAFVQRNLGAVQSSINSKEDLSGKKVATKQGTIAVEVLKSLGARIIEKESLEDAVSLLNEEKADAVVFDAPALIRIAKTNPDLMTTGSLFAEHHYAFALAPGSHELRRQINLALLKLRENGTYDRIYAKYF